MRLGVTTGSAKRTHEIRDAIHGFVHLDSQEREVLNARPIQRLRHIHQLGLSYLVYPGATHRRFEHSLGVMELATRVYDVITRPENIFHDGVRKILPDEDGRRYWRRVLRMAALCHDAGHLPFSHVAERDLLPNGWDHERLTLEIIRREPMRSFWNTMTPPLRWYDIAKVAVGPKKIMQYAKAGAFQNEQDDIQEKATTFTDWETILAEIIVGDAFGVDRMDYLLRDSLHVGVAYGRFDHYRLIDTLRIFPKEYEESDEPALGVEEGGLHCAEALLLARYFMYTQVYFHPVRRIYDLHLQEFLRDWLQPSGGQFPTDVEKHAALTDNEVLAAIAEAADDETKPGHDSARRIANRDHFRLGYRKNAVDDATNPDAVERVYKEACRKFGVENIRRCAYRPRGDGTDFPVRASDGRVCSGFALCETLQNIPPAGFDFVFVEKAIRERFREWLEENRKMIITSSE